MGMNEQALADLRQMTAEMLATTRSLAPTLAALDGRLDQLERAHIRTEAAIATLAEKLTEKHSGLAELEKRVKSLEDDRIRVKAWAALIALLGGIGSFLAGHLWK